MKLAVVISLSIIIIITGVLGGLSTIIIVVIVILMIVTSIRSIKNKDGKNQGPFYYHALCRPFVAKMSDIYVNSIR
jgi:hypothetical protein